MTDTNGADIGAMDEQAKEAKHDRRAALFCILYLLLMLAFLNWLLFDTWIKRYSLTRLAGYNFADVNRPTFQLVACAVIGGSIGGIVNAIRSCLLYYHGFDKQYVWKYITAPWMGATLALLVYALINSSVAVFGGGVATGNISAPQVLSNFAAGALAGYGSKDVFIWLDDRVHRIFRVTQPVPDVTGKTEAAAASRLHAANLELGEVTKEPHEDEKQIGIVIDQAPAPEAPIDLGKPVDITVATKKADG
jgi:PASTA domain